MIRQRRLDVTDRADVEAFAGYAIAEFGRLDAIINNAGVMPLSPMAALKVDEWDRMVDVNIKGVLYGIAAALPIMKKQGFGHIINVASTGGHRVSPTAPSIVPQNSRFERFQKGFGRKKTVFA